jgi:hypothetical protein
MAMIFCRCYSLRESGNRTRRRPAAGDAEHGESIEPQGVGEFLNITGPVEQSTTRVGVREAKSGTIGEDKPHARGAGNFFTVMGAPGSSRPVEPKDGEPLGNPHAPYPSVRPSRSRSTALWVRPRQPPTPPANTGSSD